MRVLYQRSTLAVGAFVASLWLMLAPGSSQSLTIELRDVAPDRVERQRAEAMGALPLPGTPDLSGLKERLEAKGLKAGDAMFIRVFKSESELEVWMRKDSSFVLMATYPICHWSGTLGPKVREGDKQNPEGFYTVTRNQLHLVGRHPRSLNLGFPNALDKAMGRTGSYILVHGGCSSIGCFAMTNAVMAEIYDLAAKALQQGQAHIHVHVFPFRMTDANMQQHSNSLWLDFWKNLKQGHDAFEATRVPPRISVCDNQYKVDEIGPSEVGDGSPLAVCGDTVAALESLARLPPPARNQAQLRLREQSLPPTYHQTLAVLPARPARGLHREATTTTMTTSVRLNLAGPASFQPPLPTPRCRMERPSCRKWVDLRGRAMAAKRERSVRSTRTAQRVVRP